VACIEGNVGIQKGLYPFSEHPSDRFDASPDEAMVNEEKIDILCGGLPKNIFARIDCDADFSDPLSAFDLKAVYALIFRELGKGKFGIKKRYKTPE
jgi:hypothetical protein